MNISNQGLTVLNKIYASIYNRGVAIGNQTISTSTLSSLTIPTTQEVNYCKIYVGSNPISYWLDGSTPTTTQGLVAAAGTTIEIYGTINIEKFKFIPTTGTSAVQIQYFNIDIPRHY
jgi:hypothetical protein